MPVPAVAAIVALIARSGLTQQAARMLTSRYLAKRLTASEIKAIVNRVKDNRVSDKEVRELMKTPTNTYTKPTSKTAKEEITKASTPKNVKTDIKSVSSRKEKPKPAKLPVWATREARRTALRKEIREAIKAGREPRLRPFGPLTKRDTELINLARKQMQKPKVGPATKREAELEVRRITKIREELERNRTLSAKARAELKAEKAKREAWLAKYNEGRKTPEEGRIEIPKVEIRKSETLKEREAYTTKEVGQKYKATKDTPPETRDIYILLKNPITGKPVLRNGKKVFIKETVNTNKGQSEEIVRNAIARDLGSMKTLGSRILGTAPTGKSIIIGYRTYTPKQWMRLAEKETEKRAVQGIIANTKAPGKVSAAKIDKNIASQRKFNKEVATEKANKIDPIAQANALKKNLEQLQKELDRAINKQSQSRIDKLLKEKDTLQKNLSLLEKRNKMTAPTRMA